MKLNNKVSVIVGYGGALEQETSRLFAQEGAKIVFADLSSGDGQPFMDKLKEQGYDVLYQHMDITKPEEIQAVMTRAEEVFGGIDILVNAAAASGSRTPTLELADDAWYQAIDVGLTGQYLCSKYALQTMRRGGSIIFVSGSEAMRAEPDSLCRSAVAQGMLGLMRSIASDYSQVGIRANAICPGAWGEKDEQLAGFTLMKRMGKADEIAKSLLFLASDDSSFITAAVFPVDGGLSIF